MAELRSFHSCPPRAQRGRAPFRTADGNQDAEANYLCSRGMHYGLAAVILPLGLLAPQEPDLLNRASIRCGLGLLRKARRAHSFLALHRPALLKTPCLVTWLTLHKPGGSGAPASRSERPPLLQLLLGTSVPSHRSCVGTQSTPSEYERRPSSPFSSALQEQHINVHAPGSGAPPPVTCANLNEAV